MLLAALLFDIAGCVSPAGAHRLDKPITRIAFGSCIDTNSHPMLERFVETPWDVAVLLGDNIYADTTNSTVMKAKYDALKESEFWKEARRKGPVVATWDDHDFGADNSGEEYPTKRESQRLFLDFMDEPADSIRRRREGVYDSYLLGPPGQRVQVILLDTRYFRSNLSTGINNVIPSGGRYIPEPDTSKTMLGEAQWAWLADQLRVPAELRVIGSSIQFISEFSGAEAWANFPHEKKRLLTLLENVGHVVFISGDRHWAELSRVDRPGRPPIYDLTSSSLTQRHGRGTPTPNAFREGTTYHLPNMGLILIDWKGSSPLVTLKLIDEAGNVRIQSSRRSW